MFNPTQILIAPQFFSNINVTINLPKQIYFETTLLYYSMRPHSLSHRNHKLTRPSFNSTKKDNHPPHNNFLQIAHQPTILIGGFKANRQDLLGKGFCSRVYKATHELTGEQVALKLIDLHKIKSAAQKRFLKNEIRYLQRLSQAKHIIHLRQVVQTKTHLGIVTQLCQTSVSQMMKKHSGSKRPLDIELSLKIFQEIVIGYLAMRAQGLIHRDIKTANILIGSDGEARLCDLGFATNDDNIDQDRFINVGSPLYMAPEIIKGNNYSSKGDIWALGLVFLEMLIGDFPWADVEFPKLRGALLSTRFEDLLPRDLDVKWKVMLLKCLQFHPKKRCSALQLIKYFKPDFQQSSILFSRKQSLGISQCEEEKVKNIISVTTNNTEEGRRQHVSTPGSRVMNRQSQKQEQTAIPSGLNTETNIQKFNSKELKTYSSKRLIISSNQNRSRNNTRLSNNDNIVSLKLNPNQQNKNQIIKKQLLSNLHLSRLAFKIIQMIDKTYDNLHCTYYNFSKEIGVSLVSYILQLFQENKMCKSCQKAGDVALFKKSKEFKHITSVSDQYQKNFFEYFKLKKHAIIYDNIMEQPVDKQIQHCLNHARNHLTLIFQEIQNSKLPAIDDQELCQFLSLADYMATFTQMTRIKDRNPTLFLKTNRIEDILKKNINVLSLTDIKRISKKVLQ